MQHTVQAATKMLLRVFRRADFYRLFREAPERGFDVSATSRVAFGLWTLQRRACDVALATETTMEMPFTQRDLADALGLSLVHTNKTLRKGAERQVVEWSDRMIRIHDTSALREIAENDDTPPKLRPLSRCRSPYHSRHDGDGERGEREAEQQHHPVPRRDP